MTRRFPFPIPTGWFCIGWSSDLTQDEVRPIRYFAKDLVLFRTSDGTARVLDAHCPHLGAHLGHGGKIVDDKVVCPFHAWEFDGKGTCTKLPYAKKIPAKAKMRGWLVREHSGMILVWHDIDNEPPTFEVPEFPEIGSEEWSEPEHRT